ncbi:MAG: phosphotransferase, partial [Clostridia bacterium]|nr:phosphotransferase [Clostridia bacterium]
MEENFKEIDLGNSKIIGKGQCAEVYGYDENRVVKLFYENIGIETILHEYRVTSECFAKGLSAAECFELVRYRGRTGILMQRVCGVSVEQEILKHPEKANEYARKMADTLACVHSKQIKGSAIPAADEFYSECIENCRKDGWISEAESRKLTEFVAAIPCKQTLIHGDYHVLNLMTENDTLRLIDLADVQTGNPVFDLLIANLYLHYLPENLEELYRTLIRIPPEVSLAMWDVFLRTYFQTEDAERIRRIEKILDTYSLLKIMLAPYSFSNLPEQAASGFVEMARDLLMPVIDSYTGVIPEDIAELAKEN